MTEFAGPNCLVIAEEKTAKLFRQFFETLDFFGNIDVIADGSLIGNDLVDYDYIVLSDPEDELLFFGLSNLPWIIAFSESYKFSFVPVSRLLLVPRIIDSSDQKSLSHMRKMLVQSMSGVR